MVQDSTKPVFSIGSVQDIMRTKFPIMKPIVSVVDSRMNRDVIISCAVTGAGDTVAKHDGVPVTPESVADAAISAAQAGAAIAHIHVRGIRRASARFAGAV